MIRPACLRALAAPAAALLLFLVAGTASAQDPFDEDDIPKPIPAQDGRALREVRSVPYPSGAVYLRKGITGAFLGGKYRNLGEDKSLYQWQGEVGFFYTSWFSAGLAFKINAGEPSETQQKVLNRYFANARFHKAWNRASIYIGPQIGVDNLNILSGPPPQDTIGKVLRDPIDNTNMGLGIEAGMGWKVSRWVGLTLGSISEYSLVDNESSIYGNDLNLRLVPGVAIDVLAFTDTLRELVPALYLTLEAHLGFLVLQEDRTNNDRAFLMGVGLAF